MATKEYSPFTPGVPVPVDFFVGRSREVEEIAAKAGAAATGRLERAFVIGERGIGKSSLCHYAAMVAEEHHKLLSLHVFLGGVSSLDEMVRRIFERLLKDSIDRPWHQKVRDFLGNHVRQVGLFGITVEFGAPAQELKQLVWDFVPAVRNLVKALGEAKKGLMLILDDLNGLAASLEFANWLKSQVDEMATGREPIPMLLVLVGLPERRSQLVQLQPSLGRVFDVVEIGRLTQDETKELFHRALERVQVKLEPVAADVLWWFSGGFPALAHEIGDATFKVDSDNLIDGKDAYTGVVLAADVIGRKYIEPQVFAAIRSERYRSILRKLAPLPLLSGFTQTEFTRKQAAASLDETEKRVLDNFLGKMKQLGVLTSAADLGSGGYRFASALHCVYFWLEAQRAKEQRQLPLIGAAIQRAAARRLAKG